MKKSEIEISQVRYDSYLLLSSFEGSSKFTVDLVPVDSGDFEETDFYVSVKIFMT